MFLSILFFILQFNQTIKDKQHNINKPLIKKILQKQVKPQQKIRNINRLTSPYNEIVLLELSKHLENKNKTKFIKKNWKFCKSKLKNNNINKLKTKIIENHLSINVFIELIKICDPVFDENTKIELYTFLWRNFPSHPNSVYFLKEAIRNAENQPTILLKLKRFMLLWSPENLDNHDFIKLVKSTDCNLIKKTANLLLRRGNYNLILPIIKKCNLKFKYGIILYRKGKYKQALEVFQKLTPNQKVNIWILRCKQHIFSTNEIYKIHLDDWHRTKNPKHFISALKTLILNENSKLIGSLLKKTNSININSPYLTWLQGYTSYLDGDFNKALNIWQKSLKYKRNLNEERLLYWISKTKKSILEKGKLIGHPVHSFYWRLSLSINSLLSKSNLTPLSLIFYNNKNNHISNEIQISKIKNENLKTGLILLSLNLKQYASSYLYEYLISISHRRRRTSSELYKCWFFNEGNPYKCSKTNKSISFLKNKELNLVQRSKIAQLYGWEHLNPIRKTYLPTPYIDIIKYTAHRFNLSVAMLYGVMRTESRYDPYNISPANAVGLFQMIPSTATEVAKDLKIKNFLLSQLLNPEISITFGAAYLAKLMKIFNGNPILAIAAYNGGPHHVKRWLKRKSDYIATDNWIEEIPFKETRNYIKLVIGRWILYAIQLGEHPPDIPPYISIHSYKFN